MRIHSQEEGRITVLRVFEGDLVAEGDLLVRLDDDLLRAQRDKASRSRIRRELARVIDGAAEERLRIRLDDLPGIKLSIQKQPQANTVAVVDSVEAALQRLQYQGQIPVDIRIQQVDDQARFIRRAPNNAVTAAASGALLVMTVVYLFLGSLRRTLIIGSTVPIAVLVTFIPMAAFGLTFNIWIGRMKVLIDAERIAGLKVSMRTQAPEGRPDSCRKRPSSTLHAATLAGHGDVRIRDAIDRTNGRRVARPNLAFRIYARGRADSARLPGAGLTLDRDARRL